MEAERTPDLDGDCTDTLLDLPAPSGTKGSHDALHKNFVTVETGRAVFVITTLPILGVDHPLVIAFISILVVCLPHCVSIRQAILRLPCPPSFIGFNPEAPFNYCVQPRDRRTCCRCHYCQGNFLSILG